MLFDSLLNLHMPESNDEMSMWERWGWEWVLISR